jgi:hypothetical protein
MPLTWDQISSITEKKFLPKLYDNIFEANPTLNHLKKKSYEKAEGGTSVMVPLNYAQNEASDWYSGEETLDTTDNETITAAEYAWKQIYSNITVKRLDENKNAGDRAILNFVKQKTMIAEKTLEDKLSTGVFSDGTNTKSIVGLRYITGTANSVGGISQTTYSWWQGQVDSTTTTMNLRVLHRLYNLCTFGSDAPDLIPTTRALYDIYFSLLQPQQRFMDEKKASAGFENLLFKGAPVVVDAHVTAAHLHMINSKYLHLMPHKDEDMRFDPFIKPVNQNVKTAKIYWTGIFGSSNNRMHGKFSALVA